MFLLFSCYYQTHSSPDTRCTGILHGRQFCDTSCISYNSVQTWLPVLTVRSHRLRVQSQKAAPTSMPIASPRLLHTFLYFGCDGSSWQCTGFSCGMQALECAGSVVEAHGLSCSKAYGILVLQPGIVPCFGRWILSHWIRDVSVFAS